jgi:RNA-binding protein YlmH
MDKRDILKKYASSDDDILLLARIFDKQESCYKKNYLSETKFLSERELALAELALRGEKAEYWTAWGGYEGAERKIIIFYPDYLGAEEASAEAGISFVRAEFHNKGSVSHRDMLGSLMNIGITRECLGDIIVHENFCDIICLEGSAEFIMNNLFRAGRETLTLSLLEEAPAAPEIKTETIKDTVASLRLDSVVSACCRTSRTKAAELIASGRVFVNGLECLKSDKLLEEGCGLSIRGAGKFVLKNASGVSKKGRVIVEIIKYI